MIEAHNLTLIPDIRHGFFTRQGGLSAGLYATLNCGLGSKDDRDLVMRNRAHVATSLGLSPGELLTVYQEHSAKVVEAENPWEIDSGPHADGMVTNRRGMALGILTADCAPVLFADDDAGVIGAAHAGWRGAHAKITDAVIKAMEKLGARRQSISAAIGPTIQQASYEVGPELKQAFLSDTPANSDYFQSSTRDGHFMFDLPGYLAGLLQQAGVKSVERVNQCTYRQADNFFSYRRATHKQESDYGRQISAITLGPETFLKI